MDTVTYEVMVYGYVHTARVAADTAVGGLAATLLVHVTALPGYHLLTALEGAPLAAIYNKQQIPCTLKTHLHYENRCHMLILFEVKSLILRAIIFRVSMFIIL